VKSAVRQRAKGEGSPLLRLWYRLSSDEWGGIRYKYCRGANGKEKYDEETLVGHNNMI